MLPDHALQRLEWRGLAIFGDPLLENLNHSLNIRLRLAAVQAHGPQLHGNLGLFSMFTDKCWKVFGCKRKQNVKYEADSAGSAFDVSENGFYRHTDSLVVQTREVTGNVIAREVSHPAIRVIEQTNRNKVRVLAHIKPVRSACRH